MSKAQDILKNLKPVEEAKIPNIQDEVKTVTSQVNSDTWLQFAELSDSKNKTTKMEKALQLLVKSLKAFQDQVSKVK